MSDSEDEYVYDYSDASSDEGDEMNISQQAKSPQEGDSDAEDRKPAAKKSLDTTGGGEVKTPSSKNANANPNAPPAVGGSGRKR